MNDQDLADMLHRCGPGVSAGIGKPGPARLAVVAQHADLDQLVGFQRPLYFREDCGGEAIVSDRHHGLEHVRLRLECAPHRWGHFLHGANSISRSMVHAAR